MFAKKKNNQLRFDVKNSLWKEWLFLNTQKSLSDKIKFEAKQPNISSEKLSSLTKEYSTFFEISVKGVRHALTRANRYMLKNDDHRLLAFCLFLEGYINIYFRNPADQKQFYLYYAISLCRAKKDYDSAFKLYKKAISISVTEDEVSELAIKVGKELAEFRHVNP